MLLWICFERIEDPREASGRRYSLESILKMLLTSLLSGRKSLAQIVLWGRSLSPKALESLGFKLKVPCVATLSNLLRRIDPKNVEAVLSAYTLAGKPLLEPGTPRGFGW
jgi:DDE_Tnp_1-associated